MKLKSKQQRQLRASNAAHKRLQQRNADKYTKTGREKYQQNALYHGACVVRQEKSGRVFTRAEREKVFDNVISTFY